MKTSRRKWCTRWIAVCVAIVLGVGMYTGMPIHAATSAELTISQNGIDFIKEREGFNAKCYYDGAQSSIGYGTKCGTKAHASGLHSITRADAETAMRNEINSSYIPNVRRQTSGLQMNQNQFDALVSFTYNTGGGTSMIKNSPLVKYLRGEMSQAEATSAFQNYVVTNSATGKVDSGLKNRRRLEAELFFSGVNPNPDPPTNLSITSDKTAYKVGETINFSFSYSNATDVYILIDANGVRVEPWANVTGQTSYSCTFNEPGYYVYRLYAVNEYGTPATEWKVFTVYDKEPDNLSIQCDKDCYAVGETINFNFSVNNAETAYILIDANGTRVEPWANVTGKTSYSYTFDEPGRYVYRLYAVNKYGTPATEWKVFTVYDKEPDNLSIQCDKDYYAVGEAINFDFSVNNAETAYILIDANGVRVEPWADVTGQTNYSYTFDEPGRYVYRLYAVNKYGTPATEWKEFYIYKKFDINADGKINTADAALLQSYLTNNITLTESQGKAADLNEDGMVDGFDLALLRQKLAA